MSKKRSKKKKKKSCKFMCKIIDIIKLYKAYIKMRLLNEIQYKGAAIAGVATQFAWGFMYIMLYMAFLKDGTKMEYTINQMCSYIWLQQAFLRMFNLWSSGLDNDILEECQKGDISVELIRPVSLYNIWHARTFGKKIAMVTVRAIPIFVICSLPVLGEFRLILPPNIKAFVFFILTIILSSLILMAYTMILYGYMMKVLTSKGVTITFQMVMEFCSGGVLPLVFMPKTIMQILQFTPFYYMQHTTYNIYNGFISDIGEIIKIVCIQLFWVVVLTLIGKRIIHKQTQKAIIQGG